jgi:hypothetical protein
MNSHSTSLRSPRLRVSLTFLLLSLLSSAQDIPAFDFRMVFYGPATDSAYAAEHRIRQVIKTRDSEDPSLWMVHDLLNFGLYESKP